MKPLHFMCQPTDFLWSARSYSRTILPMGVVSRARFTSGGEAIRWFCFMLLNHSCDAVRCSMGLQQSQGLLDGGTQLPVVHLI